MTMSEYELKDKIEKEELAIAASRKYLKRLRAALKLIQKKAGE